MSFRAVTVSAGPKSEKSEAPMPAGKTYSLPIYGVLAGVLAAVLAGILGGIVPVLCMRLGAWLGELASSHTIDPFLWQGRGRLVLAEIVFSGSIGLIFGTPIMAIFGPVVIWLSRNDLRKARILGYQTGVPISALLVGIQNVRVDFTGPMSSILEELGDFASAIAVGATAGIVAIFVFFSIRDFFAKRNKFSSDKNSLEGSPT